VGASIREGLLPLANAIAKTLPTSLIDFYSVNEVSLTNQPSF
jgi:hypothetical protein